MECSICLGKFNNNKNIKILNCGHQIHKKCLNNLINLNKEWSNKCPLCRKKINNKINNNLENEIESNISNNFPIHLLHLLLFNVIKKN